MTLLGRIGESQLVILVSHIRGVGFGGAREGRLKWSGRLLSHFYSSLLVFTLILRFLRKHYSDMSMPMSTLKRFQKSMEGPGWSLNPVIGTTRMYEGQIEFQNRRVQFRMELPQNFPFQEPIFQFPAKDVKHLCVDPSSGLMSSIWGEFWTPVLAHPNPIMQSFALMLSEEARLTDVSSQTK